MLDRNNIEKTMRGKEYAATQCKYLGGNVQYGFAVNPKTKKFVINEDEAENIRMAFAMIAGGASYDAVLRCLHKVGAKTRNGKEFSRTALLSMLRNERYNGVYTYNMHRSGGKQIRIPEGMPRVIDEKVFKAVQAVLTD